MSQTVTDPPTSEVGHTPAWVHAARWGLIALTLLGLGYVAQQAIEAGSWLIVIVVAFIAMSVLVVYSTRRAIPAKYLLPGLVLLLLFQIWPIVYTAATAFTNYGDGHTLSKDEAVQAIQAQSVRQDPDAPRYGMSVAIPEGAAIETGELSFLLTVAPAEDAGELEEELGEGADAGGENVTGDGYQLFVGTEEGLEPLPAEGVELRGNGTVAAAPGFRVLNLMEANQRAQEVQELAVPVGEEGSAVKAATTSQAFVGRPTISYDEDADVMTTAEGRRYVAQDGNFVPEDGVGPVLPAGWTENVGFENFRTIFLDPAFRGGFLKIFLWNLAFPLLSVVSTFLLGMLLALLFNDPRLKGKAVYRSLLVLPYALPIFVTGLVWAAMFNQQFGLINEVTGLNINWLGDPWGARAALLITNLWLGFPYMFLICTGALQSIPNDVKEAAAVDGAGPVRTLVSVTMPLLLVAVGPLLVASFAFNFNNFTLIYLVTRGGPFDSGNSLVGNTDLLINFAYRIALESGTPNIGLASAVSIVIFGLVGIISYLGFRQSNALEEVN
ncbi:ABC transporter permease subunit [Ornithinimicrobium pekingense]|uniref:Maltose/maltodextrin transport system permease protein n=1 Tax=Ornithinimicrobium pekingense TaxID=384677 RepID=A0ABQ2FA89_9MICO|nr:ABC transporter permease subunit [Ornithinimicrobium pekingense]GGK76808.1 sugar ABC transporter permease [Ornithinimicrobium pekingense]